MGIHNKIKSTVYFSVYLCKINCKQHNSISGSQAVLNGCCNLGITAETITSVIISQYHTHACAYAHTHTYL